MSSIAALREHPRYLALPAADRTRAEAIMADAQASTRPDYYLNYLQRLFDTVEAPTAAVASEQRETMQAAARRARRSPDPRREERISRTRVFERLGPRADGPYQLRINAPGHDRTLDRSTPSFEIDRRDARDIAVRVRVCVRGAASERRAIRDLEDAIEKRLQRPGFSVDLVLVDEPRPGDFIVNSNPALWPTAENWVGDETTLAHELLHLLELHDEYDYVESHAANPEMRIAERLYWFHAGMRRTVPVDAYDGLMGGGTQVHERYVCEVARLDVPTCVGVRVRGSR